MDPSFFFIIIVIILSVVIHELAHGYVAYSMGDPTAKYAGRLTLNPIPHLDLFGSIILPGILLLTSLATGVSPIIFAWAKPVPINPYNFRDQKWGKLKVALAGPATNVTIAVIFGLMLRFLPLPLGAPFGQFLGIVVLYNFLLAIFNLIPIPPLDGHWILFTFIPDRFATAKQFLEQYGMYILIFLIFFGPMAWLGHVGYYLFHLVSGQ